MAAGVGVSLIAELGLNKGGMTLVDADGARRLYEAMGPAREISGGSAANTLAGLAALGGLVAAATDGETFGHHHQGAEHDIAHALTVRSSMATGMARRMRPMRTWRCTAPPSRAALDG